MFTQKWLILLVPRDPFQWVFLIYQHYQMRGELLHHTWTFLSTSTCQTEKTPRLAKLLAGRHLIDKLLMVMRDLSSRSSISRGLLVQTHILLIKLQVHCLCCTMTTSNPQDSVVVNVYLIYKNWNFTSVISRLEEW